MEVLAIRSEQRLFGWTTLRDGSENDISDCKFGGWGQHNCGHGENVGIECDIYDLHYLYYKHKGIQLVKA